MGTCVHGDCSLTLPSPRIAGRSIRVTATAHTGARLVTAHRSTQSQVPNLLHASKTQAQTCRADSVQITYTKAEKTSGAGAHVGYSLPSSIVQTACCLRNSSFFSLPSWKLACTHAGLKARCKQRGKPERLHYWCGALRPAMHAECSSRKPCSLWLPS